MAKYLVVDNSFHSFQKEWEFTNKKKAISFAYQYFRENKYKNFHVIVEVIELDNDEFAMMTIKDYSNRDDNNCWGNC